MTPRPAKPRYVVTLEAAPGGADVTLRLRCALKVLLRRFGLKCISVYEADDAEARGPAEPAASEGQP